MAVIVTNRRKIPRMESKQDDYYDMFAQKKQYF